MAILKILWQDARRNFKSVAKEVGISTSAVQARFNKMKKAGLIKGSTVKVNVYNLKGYIAQLCIRSVESETQAVINYIYSLKMENANILCWECAGHYNILSWLYLKEPIKLHAIKYLVQQHPSIIEVNTSIFTEYSIQIGRAHV
jgi:DNA-binding Lrp family transcriptional regulator